MKHRLGFLLALMVALGVQGCASPFAAGRRFFERRAEADVEAPEVFEEAAPEPAAAEQPESIAYRLRISDVMSVQLLGIPNPQSIDTMVDEEGNIYLPYLDDPLRAAGRTRLELERAIRSAYQEQLIYRNLTVNVTVPTLSYFMRGEVRAPGRYPLISGVSLMQAVAAAGGYTDYASARRVRIIRDGETLRLNLRRIEQHAEKDIPLKDGDVIVIPRSFF